MEHFAPRSMAVGHELPTEVSSARHAMSFGRYIVLPSARELLFDGAPVCIGARAFDLLVVLLASRGRVVSKDEINRYVWPTTTVDESNLRFQMTLLRKALGCNRNIIKTIPGRGYLLAVELEAGSAPPDRTISRPTGAAGQPSCQSAVSDALRAFLHVLSRHPDAIGTLENMLTSAHPEKLKMEEDAVLAEQMRPVQRPIAGELCAC